MHGRSRHRRHQAVAAYGPKEPRDAAQAGFAGRVVGDRRNKPAADPRVCAQADEEFHVGRDSGERCTPFVHSSQSADQASSTGSRTGTQFDALVASIARQLQNGIRYYCLVALTIVYVGDENKIAMLQGLVKEAVQAEVLRKGGRSGEVEDMEIPDEAAGTEDTSDKMDKVKSR